jgi:hypothetical protein
MLFHRFLLQKHLLGQDHSIQETDCVYTTNRAPQMFKIRTLLIKTTWPMLKGTKINSHQGREKIESLRKSKHLHPFFKD